MDSYKYIYTLCFLTTIVTGRTFPDGETNEDLGSLLRRFRETERTFRKLDYKDTRQARLNAKINAIARELFDSNADSDADIAARDLLDDDGLLEEVIRELISPTRGQDDEGKIAYDEAQWPQPNLRDWYFGDTDGGARATSTTPARPTTTTPPETPPTTTPAPTPAPTPSWLLRLLRKYMKNRWRW